MGYKTICIDSSYFEIQKYTVCIKNIYNKNVCMKVYVCGSIPSNIYTYKYINIKINNINVNVNKYKYKERETETVRQRERKGERDIIGAILHH